MKALTNSELAKSLNVKAGETKKQTEKNILDLIKEQIGLELNLCDYFTGIKEHNGQKYFNVILSQRTSESQDFDKLKRFAEQYKLIKVEPNGLKRVAVFLNGL